MKNKKSVYLLIFCVVSVWGIIGYRIYSGMGEDNVPDKVGIKASKAGYFKLLDHSKDTYELSADYLDPFLVIASASAEPVISTPIEPKGIKEFNPIAKPQINWSGIIYNGYILNPQNKKRVGIFNINGKETMLSEGEESGGLKISKFIGDSVKVIYQKANRFISIR